MNKTIKTVSLAVVALVVIYLGYQLLERWMNPCEGVFQQTAVSLGTKLDVIKAKGEFAIGRQKIQDLAERSQEVALNLKSCCIVLGKVSSEFLRCKEGFDRYDADIKKVAGSIEEAAAARQRGDTTVADQKIAEVEEGVKTADTRAQAFAQQVAEIKGKDKEKPSDKRGAQAVGQAAPVTTGYATVHVFGDPKKGRLQIKVNGLLAGQYDHLVIQDLDPLLTPGANNTITFTFSQPEGSVDVSVKLPGSNQSVSILKFVAKPEKLEDSVQIPYVGGKK
jgi:membrane protein implicated in regulation of membrane protease activity